MKKLLLLLGILGIVSISLFGQRQDTIYQNLAQGSTASTSFLGPVTNIGQGSHQLVVAINDPGGVGACKAGLPDPSPGIAVYLYGSYFPNANIGNAVRLPSISFVQGIVGYAPVALINVQAQGPFPYVYAYVDGVDVTNCTYDVNYSGSLYPFPPTNPTWQSHFVKVSTTANGAYIPIVVANTGLYGFSVSIIQLLLSNSTAAQTVQFTCKNSSPINQIIFGDMTAGQIINIPPGELPTVNCLTQDGIYMILTNATEVDTLLTYKLVTSLSR